MYVFYPLCTIIHVSMNMCVCLYDLYMYECVCILIFTMIYVCMNIQVILMIYVIK